MSKNNGYDDELKGNRTNPYDDMPDDEYEEGEASEYEDEEYEEEEGGFLSSGKGKALLGVIAALLLILLALLAFLAFGGKKAPEKLPEQTTEQQQATQVPEFTQAPAPIVFAPTVQATEDPELIAEDETEEETEQIQQTQVPVIVVDETPTPEPEPTATPLPIIMSNTPTPSPTPTATPTPSPSPSPTPSPKPTATPQVDLGNGVTNRDAKLRESASSSGKIKQTIKKGETVTIHEAILDKDGKVWYALTVDEQATDGFMRDYVINVDGKIDAPTPTPKATAEPKATPEPSNEMTVSVDHAATAEPELADDVIATGKTNRDANLRKVMNGKVITTLRKGKAVEILSVRTDKSGNIWYEARQSGKDTVGFMRDYVVTLDEGAELEMPEPTAAPAEKPEKEEAVEQEVSEQPEAKTEEQAADVIGKAKTNRDANVREKPVSSAKLVRQLSKGNALNIFAKYEDDKGQIWYEVATESGKTKGFVRDYVVNVLNIDKTAEAKKYEEETEESAEKETEVDQNETVRESRFKYAGNKESKVFHELSCDNLPSSSKNLVYMESRSYAVNTGYTPCENCNP